MTQTFDETKHPRDDSGQFATKPASEATVDLGDPAATPVLDPTGPGGWGSYSSEVVLGRDVDVDDPEIWTVPAGTRARLRTDFTNLDEGEGSDQPLRLDVMLEIDGVDHTPYGCSWATLVDAEDPEPARFDALARIHDNMRAAATTTDEKYLSLHGMASEQATQTATPRADTSDDDDLNAVAEAQTAKINEVWGQKAALDRQIARASVTGACATVRQKYPEATTLTIEDNYDGGVSWSAHRADGTEIEELGDDLDLEDDLYEYGSYVDLDRPSTLVELAKDHDPKDTGPAWSGEVVVDKHTSSIDKITIDIDQMLAEAHAPKG